MIHTRPRATVLGLALTLAGVSPANAWAQGFGLNEIGTCAEARGFANTGAPCHDASSIYWNPAATASLPGFSIYGGASAIRLLGGFKQDSTRHQYNANVPTVVTPAVFLNFSNSIGPNKYALGFGVYVPYGLISQWRTDFPGRFASQRASLQSIYLQPNISFEIIPSVLSIGGGPVIGLSSIRLDQAQDLSTFPVPGAPLPGITFADLGIAPGTEAAVATLKATATAPGFNVGIHANVLPVLQVGAHFLSQVVFNYKNGTASFRQIGTGLTLPANNPLGVPGGTPVDALLASQFTGSGPFTSQGVSTKITHPYQFQVGIGYTGLSQTTLSVDYAVVGWSAFKMLPINFQGSAAANSQTILANYVDSWSIRSGLEHVFGDPVVGFIGRLGFSYAKTPVPRDAVVPLLPDMNRFNYSAGIGYPVTKNTAIDLTYIHVGTQGRRGLTAQRTTTVNNNLTYAQLDDGFYTLAANVVSLSLKLGF
jgi:long-chain fatty acid transport protein